jgi:hypothetical protein
LLALAQEERGSDMKHVVVFIALALATYFLATRKTDLDELMIPTVTYSESQVGNRFVDLSADRLPTTPRELAEAGVTTVVYFHDDACSGCLQLDANLVDFLRVRPDVAVRKIRMSPDDNGYTKAIRDYRWRVWAAPCILIFGKNGQLIAADDRTDWRGQDLLEEWIAAELRKAARSPN